MSTERTELRALIKQGAIPEEHIADAVDLLNPFPGGRDWAQFLDRLFLIMGALALSASVMFFIAYNWDALGRFTKFAGIQAFIIVAVGSYCLFDSSKLSSRLLLVFASICVGVLLGLYGQSYQTGADPWQLFFNWALLILPWVFAARLAALWLLWIGLLNVSLSLYFQQGGSNMLEFLFRGETQAAWSLFGLNITALAVWEWFNHRRSETARWPCRLLAMASGCTITILAIWWVLDVRAANAFTGLVWPLWIAAMYASYRRLIQDLFMLAGMCLSGIVVITTFFGHLLLDDFFAGGFLFLALIVIGMGSAATTWLRRVHRKEAS